MSSSVSPITSRGSLVEWTARFVQPPGAQYLAPDDKFMVDIATSFAPSTSSFAARILTPEGEVHFQRHTVDTEVTRLRVRQIFPAREGFLLGFAVALVSGAIGNEWNYASVGLSREDTGGAFPFHGLVQGYFDRGGALYWPNQVTRLPTEGPGFFRGFGFADPAAGVQWTITVPDSARWRLAALEAELVTDATVTNRRFILTASRGGQPIFRAVAGVLQAASLTFRYVVGHWGESGDNRNGVILVNWPDHVFLAAGDILTAEVVNFQAGDNFGAPTIYVEEWFEGG